MNRRAFFGLMAGSLLAGRSWPWPRALSLRGLVDDGTEASTIHGVSALSLSDIEHALKRSYSSGHLAAFQSDVSPFFRAIATDEPIRSPARLQWAFPARRDPPRVTTYGRERIGSSVVVANRRSMV